MSFIRRSDEKISESKIMFGGSGPAVMTKLLNGAEEMGGKGRVFNHFRLEKGCEIGWHIHRGDCETYYILKGEAEYNDNGTVKTLLPGDVTFTGDGEGHSIRNNRDEALEGIALILYK